MSKMNTPLKWAGGKRWQVKHIAQYWAPHEDRRFVEPFCGGLSVALGLQPKIALLNDINPHVVNFYTQLKLGFSPAIEMENTSECYYRSRSRFNALIEAHEDQTAEAAALFYYLNRTCFNGLCRFNLRGGFNVPFGRYAKINYRSDFSEYREGFAPWSFLQTDFEDIGIKSGDFIYADPPYDVPFTQYSKGGFNWDDQVRAATWLARHDGPVILVNQATLRINNLYSDLGFNIGFIGAPRRISCTGDRTPALEVFATRGLS